MQTNVPRRVTRHLTFDATPAPVDRKEGASDADANPLSRSINVFLRIRPFSEAEQTLDPASCVLPQTNDGILYIRPNKPDKHPPAIRQAKRAVFRFSQVFSGNATQDAVFERTTLPLISHLFRGESAVVFAYGVTCSGKTFTIQGTPEAPGILPRALDVIINSIAKAKGSGLAQDCIVSDDVAKLTDESMHQRRRLRPRLTSRKPSTHDPNYLEVDSATNYSIYASYLEVYNDQVYDLFNKNAIIPIVDDSVGVDTTTAQQVADDAMGTLSQDVATEDRSLSALVPEARPFRSRRPHLKIKERLCSGTVGEKEVYAEGQTEVPVRSVVDIERLLDFGCNNRTVAHTQSNTSSSRSHAIFVITLKQEVIVPGTEGTKRQRTTSRLQIVDLAGSEKISRENHVTNRAQESRQINTSLMTLSRCLECLRRNQRLLASGDSEKVRIVPFRDSKLTRLLQRALSTGSAVMIATMSPVLKDADETIHTLRNAAIAREVKLKYQPSNRLLTDVTNANKEASVVPVGALEKSEPDRKQGVAFTKGGRVKSIVRRPLANTENFSNTDILRQENLLLKEKLLKAEELRNTWLAREETFLEQEAVLRKEVEKLRYIASLAENALTEGDREREKLFRENERLREEIAYVKGMAQSLEYEIRAEIGEQWEKVSKNLEENYEKQLKGMRDRNSSRLITGQVEQASRRIMRTSAAAFAKLASAAERNDEESSLEEDETVYEESDENEE